MHVINQCRNEMFWGTNRIPSGDGSESIGAAARVRARRDVVDAKAAVAVQHDIEEAEPGPAG